MKIIFDPLAGGLRTVNDSGGVGPVQDLDASTNPNYPAAVRGDRYRITVAGRVGGVSGKIVEPGDTIEALSSNAGGTEAAVGADWFAMQANIAGITSAGLSMMQAADAAAQRTLLGLGTMALQAASAVAITGGTATGLTSLGLRNAGTGVFDLTIAHNGTLTAGRTLTLDVGDAARTLTLSGSPTLSGVTITGTGTLATTAAKTLTFSNTLTLAGTDGSTLNVGGGGTLGSAAFTAATAYVAAGTAALLTANLFTGEQYFNSTTIAGLRANNLTTTQKNALTAAAGMMVYDTTLSRMQSYDGAAWHSHVRLDGDTMTGVLNLTPATPGSALAITSGTVTTSLPFLTGTQTWSAGGVVFKAATITITDTASAAGSMGFQILGGAAGTTNLFNVSKDGRMTFGYSGAAATTATADANQMAWAAAGSGGMNLISTNGFFTFTVGGGSVLTMAGGTATFITPAVAFENSGTGNLFYLVAKAGNNICQLGLDAAGVSNQMITAANRITSDGVGADLTIAAGNGRGAAGGTLIFSTFTTAGAATIGTLTTRMTIDTAGALAFPNITAVVSETVISDRTLAISINGTAYKICLKA